MSVRQGRADKNAGKPLRRGAEGADGVGDKHRQTAPLCLSVPSLFISLSSLKSATLTLCAPHGGREGAKKQSCKLCRKVTILPFGVISSTPHGRQTVKGGEAVYLPLTVWRLCGMRTAEHPLTDTRAD